MSAVVEKRPLLVLRWYQYPDYLEANLHAPAVHGGGVRVEGDRAVVAMRDAGDHLASKSVRLPPDAEQVELRFSLDTCGSRRFQIGLQDQNLDEMVPEQVSPSPLDAREVTHTYRPGPHVRAVRLYLTADQADHEVVLPSSIAISIPQPTPAFAVASGARPIPPKRQASEFDRQSPVLPNFLRRLVVRAVPQSSLSTEKLKELIGLGRAPEVEPHLAGMSEENVSRLFPNDDYLQNQARSMWEFAQGHTVLTSYPWDVCLPIADICNARCTFCSSWLEGTKLLEVDKIDAFEGVLRFARIVGLAGHGEPLAHPQIDEILRRLSCALDPRAAGYVITNGVYLKDQLDDLINARVFSYAISLNAATESTHREVMGLPKGSFGQILDSIRELIRRRDANKRIFVSISLVVTQQNLEEIPGFIDLSHDLGVNKVQLKTLAPQMGLSPGLNYHLLAPYLHPKYPFFKENALDAVKSSRIEIQADPASWDSQIFPEQLERELAQNPPKTVSREEAIKGRATRVHWRNQTKYEARTRGEFMFDVDDFDGNNSFGRVPRYSCRAPYYHLYINDFSYNVTPCCYLAGVPGHDKIIFDGSYPFFEAWNSEAMVALRRRLRDGPLYNMCTKCPGTY